MSNWNWSSCYAITEKQSAVEQSAVRLGFASLIRRLQRIPVTLADAEMP
jgi:hypothetical protein